MCMTRRPLGAGLLFSVLAAAALCAPTAGALEIVVQPYLQYPTQTGITVCWETDQPAASEAAWGVSATRLNWVAATGGGTVHQAAFTGLEADQCYFYQVRSAAADGTKVESAVLTFQTAVGDESPFSFIVMCDTQSNPNELSTLANLAWGQRPHFVMLGGDLVSDGTVKEQWTGHFFANMHPLISRAALIPTLGNHDKDSPYYYEYFALPAPEYCYSFRYGNLEVFLLDSQRFLREGSEQYVWAEGALKASKADWKIVCFHKVPYSSDFDDYGKTDEARTAGGDMGLRRILPMFEKHGVDIVWGGHIHSYERTHPLKGGQPVLKGGILYMVTGGGGGGLEQFAPWRLPFSAKVYSGHHYCLVSVHGPTLRIEARDLQDRIFDQVELTKGRR